ncbi:MAG: helix-turn-helix domain-containing protein [Gemmataceae bacterium]|nr:helix-turn-helix domain-containing protein [Gemmataceae bacterium]
MTFGKKLRSLRQEKGLTLRALAEATGLNFTYLSKVETGRVPYTPSADKIRALAKALGVDSLELLRLADKVPPELEDLTSNVKARKFIERAREVASPDDWAALLDLLERRQAERSHQRTDREASP